MKENELGMEYDLAAIETAAKKKLRRAIIVVSLCAAALIGEILISIFWGAGLYAFIPIAIVAYFAVFFSVKELKRAKIFDYLNAAKGTIAEVHKESKTVDTKAVGGVNPFGKREYDSYTRKENSLVVFLNTGDTVRSYELLGTSDEHESYYERRGEAVKLSGTHYPILKAPVGDRWLCPFCGSFNGDGDRICSSCRNKVMK